MRSIGVVLLCLLLALRASVCLPQALDTPVLAEADALLREGQPEQAWQLLAPLEKQHAGRPDFDYLLGVAALESGRANRATFILERVLAVNPGHLAARLEMARAYFALRDFERAEREFDVILASAPPPDIRALSQRYLATIRTGTRPLRTGFSGYAETTIGRDTNVAAAAAQGSFFIPVIETEFFPDPLFRRRPDDFVALGAGLEYAHAVQNNLGLTGGADVALRRHSDVDAFDTRALHLHGTVVHRADERDQLQFMLQHSQYDLDNAGYREAQSLGAQWSRALSGRSRIAAAALGYRLRYTPEDAKTSSSDLYIAGAGITHVLERSTVTTATGGLYFGHDNAVAGRPDGDRRIVVLNLGLQRLLHPSLEGYVRLSILGSDYQTQNPDFAVTRRDRQLDAAAGFAWEFAPGWSLRPQVARTSNRSNINLNEYRRTETAITLRRVWD